MSDRNWVNLYVSRLAANFNDLTKIASFEPKTYAQIVDEFRTNFELSNVQEGEAMEALRASLIDNNRREKRKFPNFSEIITYIKGIRNRMDIMKIPDDTVKLRINYKSVYDEIMSLLPEKYRIMESKERAELLGKWSHKMRETNPDRFSNIPICDFIDTSYLIMLEKLREKYKSF